MKYRFILKNSHGDAIDCSDVYDVDGARWVAVTKEMNKTMLNWLSQEDITLMVGDSIAIVEVE